MRDTTPHPLTPLIAFCLNGLGTLSLCASVTFCYMTFATHDYRPIVTAGLVSWLLGVACLGFSCRRGWLPRLAFAALCGPATLLVGAEMLRRGDLVIEYLVP